MSVRAFPHLGRDPAPGDVELTRVVVRQVGSLSVELGRIVAEVDGANSGQWTGQAAEAFRASLRGELLPLLRTARDSFDRARHSLSGWADTLAGFQAEAQALELAAASRQATLGAARRALSPSPSGADATTLARWDHNVARATAAVAQLEHHADELHDRYLRAASAVAGELEGDGWIAPTELGGWLGRLGESTRSWMEKLRAPVDLLAGDQWLELVLAKGRVADHGLVAWEDVAVSARRFTALAQAAEFCTEDWAQRTGWIRGATSWSEGFEGVMGVAGEVPVVGQVIMIGTGVYLGGDYAYYHGRWFHNTCDTVGHSVAHAASSAWHWMMSW